MNIKKLPFFIKLVLTVLGSVTALMLPILLYYIGGGFKNSISLYVIDPNCANIFNFSIIIIAVSLMVRKIYIIPALILMLIVFFDVPTYPTIHNIFAGMFFTLIGCIILYSRKFMYAILMGINLFVLMFFKFYFFEVIAIFIVIMYNIEIMYLILKKEITN